MTYEAAGRHIGRRQNYGDDLAALRQPLQRSDDVWPYHQNAGDTQFFFFFFFWNMWTHCGSSGHAMLGMIVSKYFLERCVFF
jgi:hypothetical protein